MVHIICRLTYIVLFMALCLSLLRLSLLHLCRIKLVITTIPVNERMTASSES